MQTNFALYLHSFDQCTVNVPGHRRRLFTSFWPCQILGQAGTVLRLVGQAGPGLRLNHCCFSSCSAGCWQNVGVQECESAGPNTCQMWEWKMWEYVVGVWVKCENLVTNRRSNPTPIPCSHDKFCIISEHHYSKTVSIGACTTFIMHCICFIFIISFLDVL